MDSDKVKRLLAYQGGADLTSTSGLKIRGRGPAVKSDTRSIASKAWDTINPLDNGRSWTEAKPKNTKSVVQQIPDFYRANALGLGRSITGTVQGAAGLYDLVTPGTGTNRVTKIANRVAETADREAAKRGLDMGTYQISQGINDVAQFFIPGAVAPKVASKVPMLSKLSGFVSRIPGMTKVLPRLANVGVDVAQGAGQRSARGEDVSLKTVGVDALLSGGIQGAGDLASIGFRKLFAGEKDTNVIRNILESTTGTQVDEKIIQEIADATDEIQVQNALDKIRTSEVNLNAKEAAKNPINATTIAESPKGGITPDALSTVMETMVKTTEPSKLRGLVKQLMPDASDGQAKRIAGKIAKADNDIDVANILVDSMDKRPAQVRTEAIKENTVKVEDTTVSPENMAKAEEATKIDAPNQSGTTAPVASAQAPDTTLGAQTNKVADEAISVADIPTGISSEEYKKIITAMNSAKTRYVNETKKFSRSRGAALYAGDQMSRDMGAVEGYKAKLRALKGRKKESTFTGVELPDSTLDNIVKSIRQNTNLLPGEKLNRETAILKLFGKLDGTPTPSERRHIKEILGTEVATALDDIVEVADSSKVGVSTVIANIAGLPKSLMSTFDFSAPRQAGALAARHPIEFIKEYAKSFKAAFNPEYHEKYMKEIADDPATEVIINVMGVNLPGAGGSVEENLANMAIAEKIPVYGKTVIEGSARAYDTLLTGLRYRAAKQAIDAAGGPAEYRLALKALYGENADRAGKAYGNMINTLSGRGGAEGGLLSRHMATAGKMLFAPRLWAANIQRLNPAWYIDLARKNPEAAKEAVRAQLTFMSMAASVLAVASASGADVETDMRSADFAKIKVGNTRYDILGGQQQNLVQAWRQISGQKKNSETGEITGLGEEYGDKTRFDLFVDMLISKSNPLIGTAVNLVRAHKDENDRWWQATTQYGDNINVPLEIAKLGVPLNISGIAETATDRGSVPLGIAMSVPGVFGAGVQTYGSTPSKNAGGTKEEPKWKGEIPENFVTDKNGEVIFDKDGKPVEVKFEKDATSLEKQAMIDDKRTSALRENFKAGLPKEEKALLDLSDDKLEQYLEDGKITQAQYDTIDQYRVDLRNIEGVKIPEGIKSTNAKSFYENYNSMSKKAQEAYLKSAPDENATKMVERINSQLPEGITKLKPSNEIAKMYADFENELNTQNWSEIDKRNKEKTFLTSIIKKDKDPMTNDIYTEGPSKDLEYFMSIGAVDRTELDRAIQLDNELYGAGLASQKFSNKFRRNNGYGELSSGSTSGSTDGSGGSKKGLNINISSFLSSSKVDAPNFSPVSTKSRVAVKRSLPKPSGPRKRVSIKL